jgi:microcystin-dependent protein
MGLEAATYISDLVSSNPVSGDSKSQGDDHLRLIKAALKSTFPNAGRGFYFPAATSRNVSGTIAATEDNGFVTVDTSAGPVTITLPGTLAGINLWTINICKFTGDTNPVFVVPPSGNIDGYAKIRLNVPHEVTTFVWLGTFFSRVVPYGQLPPGTHLEFGGDTVPVGYLAEAGQSLVAADYPELFSVWGYKYGGAGANFSLPNAVGTVLASIDAASARLDATNLGVAPTAVGNVGGAKSHTLTTTQIPAHLHANTIDNPTHDHGVTSASVDIQSGDGGTGTAGKPVFGGTRAVSVDIAPASPGLTITNANTGGGTAHPIVQPTMISNRMVRAC